MNIGIFGRGRLGLAVAKAINEHNTQSTQANAKINIVWQIDQGEFPTANVELVFDASIGAAVPEHLEWALQNKINLVVGATGYDAVTFDAVKKNSANLPIGILVASNFSLGIAFMRKISLALGRLAQFNQSYDLALVERHHRAKIDAPSGTAKTLAGALLAGAPRYSAYSLSPAAATEIPIASLRSGTDIGYHEVRCTNALESISLTHEAFDRGLFAQGAVTAIQWMAGKKGFYLFDDLAKEIIDRLFN